MGLILLEALGAGAVLILIIWWTMFSGRKRGELPDEPGAGDAPAPAEPPPRDGRACRSMPHDDVGR